MRTIITALTVMMMLLSCIGDEDVNGNSSGKGSGWVKEWEGGRISGITITPSNKIYVGGGGGVSEITVFGYDGKEILNKEWSGDEMTTGFPSIISDESENIYTAGSNSLLKKPFLIKFDKDLNELWREELPEDGLNVDALSIDNSENIIAGMRNGDILKFSPKGKELWHHNISTEDAKGQINALAVDSEGNIYAGGLAWNDLFGESAGGSDAFLVKIAPDKTHVWEKQWGGAGDDASRALVYDEIENTIYVAGGRAFMIKKFSADGNELWTNQEHGVLSMTQDNQGNIFIGSGDVESLVEKYNSNGEKIWGSAVYKDAIAHAIACDSYGNVYAAGVQNNSNFLIKIPASEMK